MFGVVSKLRLNIVFNKNCHMVLNFCTSMEILSRRIYGGRRASSPDSIVLQILIDLLIDIVLQILIDLLIDIGNNFNTATPHMGRVAGINLRASYCARSGELHGMLWDVEQQTNTTTLAALHFEPLISGRKECCETTEFCQSPCTNKQSLSRAFDPANNLEQRFYSLQLLKKICTGGPHQTPFLRTIIANGGLAKSTARRLIQYMLSWWISSWVWIALLPLRLTYRVLLLVRQALGNLARVWGKEDKANSDRPEGTEDIYWLATSCGIGIRAHTVWTPDMHALTLHQLFLLPRSEATCSNAYNERDKHGFPVVLFHGLLQDSESFLAGGEQSLAAVLVRRGYDVYLTNARGSKYSWRHLRHTRSSTEYWDFGLDELAQDGLTTMQYVRECSARDRARSVSHVRMSCIGFSQGSAQIALALALNPDMCRFVSLYVALAPALRPTKLSDTWLSRAVHSHPELLYYVFGRRQILSPVLPVKRLVGPSFFASACVTSMRFLFDWSCDAMQAQRRTTLFQHIFSPGSVKLVVHWFQIMEGDRFQSYRPSPSLPTLLASCLRTLSAALLRKIPRKIRHVLTGPGPADEKPGKKPAGPADFGLADNSPFTYELQKIACPVAVVAGAADRLIDPTHLAESVPDCIFSHLEPGLEHLDLLWADEAHAKVFPHITRLLEAMCSES
eukprot:g75982.t1